MKRKWPTLEGRLNQPLMSRGEALKQMKANGDVLTPLAEKELEEYLLRPGVTVAQQPLKLSGVGSNPTVSANFIKIKKAMYKAYCYQTAHEYYFCKKPTNKDLAKLIKKEEIENDGQKPKDIFEITKIKMIDNYPED